MADPLAEGTKDLGVRAVKNLQSMPAEDVESGYTALANADPAERQRIIDEARAQAVAEAHAQISTESLSQRPSEFAILLGRRCVRGHENCEA